MEKFKVGDRVKLIKTRAEGGIVSGEYKKGHKATYVGNDDFKMDNGSIQTNSGMDCFTKIGSPISKYENLKQRIEALDDGWNKEADDILVEMFGTDKAFFIEINNYHSDSDGAEIRAYCADSKDEKFGKFRWKTQCSKLEAFKKALHWLLDHSDIPKVDKEKETQLENLLDRAKGQVDSIEKELKEIRG